MQQHGLGHAAGGKPRITAANLQRRHEQVALADDEVREVARQPCLALRCITVELLLPFGRGHAALGFTRKLDARLGTKPPALEIVLQCRLVLAVLVEVLGDLVEDDVTALDDALVEAD